MNKIITLSILVFIILGGCCTQKQIIIIPNKSVILDSSVVRKYNLVDKKIQLWDPTLEDISEMESNFYQLECMKSTGGVIGDSIGDINEYKRQYAGAYIDGKKVIIINAFFDDSLFGKNWKTKPVIIFDGGCSVWMSYYDVEKHKFTKPICNGLG